MRTIALMTALLVCLIVTAASARVQTIFYDDRDTGTSTSFDDLAVGDIESVRFTALSPCLVKKAIMRFVGEVGEVEFHLWADDGTGKPDLDKDLIDPIVATTPGDGHWLNVTLDPPFDVETAGEFHAGYVKLGANPDLSSDITVDNLWRSWSRSSGAWEKNQGDYHIRLEVDWYDEPEEHIFEEVSEQAEVSVSARVAWCDFNNDGYDDICAAGLKLYGNRTDGTFKDITESAGVDEIPASGCVCADFDNDGYVDIFAMLNSLTDYDRILHNNGDWTFTDVTRQVLDDEDLDYFPTEGAAWGDIDNDGYVDLYLANYEVIDPETPDDLGNCTQDKLYYNNKGEYFMEVALQAGMDEGLYPFCGRGVAWSDYDNDGDLDIFVSNYRLDPNFLWENKGGGQFEEVAKKKGVQGTPNVGSFGHTIGSSWADFNDDGYQDLLMLNLAHPRFIEFSDVSGLFINQGPPDFEFVDVIMDSGIFYDELHSHPTIGDYDNDGELDAMLTAVYDGQVSFLFRGDGDLHFTETTYQAGIELDNGWGAAWGDYDNDGLLDLLVSESKGRNLWRNTGLGAEGNHWLKVLTYGSEANYASIGTKVEVTIGDRTMTRVVTGGTGTTCQESANLHFGLGENEMVDLVKIVWLGGGQMELEDVAADQTLVIYEGQEEENDDDDGDDDDDDDKGCGC